MSVISPLRDKWKGFDGCSKNGHAPLAGCAFHSCRGYLPHRLQMATELMEHMAGALVPINRTHQTYSYAT